MCAPVFLVFVFDNMFYANINVRCSVKRVREKECEIPVESRLSPFLSGHYISPDGSTVHKGPNRRLNSVSLVSQDIS